MEVAGNASGVVAHWRESGRWWDGEPYRDVTRRVLLSGRVVEEVREARCLGDAFLNAEPAPLVEDHTSDFVMKGVKTRDEKVKLALGLARSGPTVHLRPVAAPYALLHAVSGYAFGRGAMLADEIPPICASKGIAAALLADPFSVAGSWEFDMGCRVVGVKPLHGATVTLPEGGEVVLVARNPIGWRSLCRLLTACHLGEPRLFPLSTWERLEEHREGLLLLTGGDGGPLTRLLPSGRVEEAARLLDRLIGVYGRSNVVVEVERSYLPWERSANGRLLEMAESRRLLAVAGGLTTHARRGDAPAQDVLACAHSLCGIEDVIGRKPTRTPTQPPARDVFVRALNAERFIRSPQEMSSLYADRPDLLESTLEFADMCDDRVLPARAVLPTIADDEPALLERMVWLGARQRYGHGLASRRGLDGRIARELRTIAKLGYSGHFLVAAEMCEWAGAQGIAMSGRGSVVDSVVAYCLGMSRIDADEFNLAFERFLPEDGTKRPDIDIDFQANRREEIRQHLVEKYGADHVATVAAYGAYDTRGIVREVGKVMGVPPESLAFLAKRLHGGVTPEGLEDALERRPELRDSGIPKERYRWVFRLAERLRDVPRGLRAHPSGILVSKHPIRDYVPVVPSAVEGVNLIQWDKRSAKRVFDKFDCLCLRALDILSHSQDRIRPKEPNFDEARVRIDDPEVFRAMRAGDLVGITQSASPAMTSAHVRVRTASLPDAGLVQACIRPGVGGAIKNDLLVRRRFGERYELEHPLMEPILRRTYGIVVYQEQVDQLLVAFAGYTEGQAEEIREGIYKRRRENYVQSMKDEIVGRVADRFDARLAEIVYDLVAPYQGYGFAEGHALAFAETTIRSLKVKLDHPAEFFASALEAQPAGYYPAHTLANEARIKGVRILPLDVNASGLGYQPEDVSYDGLRVPNGGVRLPLTRVAGVSRGLAARAVAEREGDPYDSLGEFAARVRPDEDELEALVLAGAFDSLHRNRRAALWGVSRAAELARAAQGGGLVPAPIDPIPEDVTDFLPSEKSLVERRLLGLDVEHHLMAYERQRVASRGGITTREARESPEGTLVMCVGNPMRLRFPPTKSGRRVAFADLEDEAGLLNVTVFDDVYMRYGHALVTEPYVVVWARVQVRQGHPAFLASKIIPYAPKFGGEPIAPQGLPLVTADFMHQ